MPDQDTSATILGGFKDAAQRSQEAGVADESAAYETAVDTDAPASADEGDPKRTHDDPGTSETD